MTEPTLRILICEDYHHPNYTTVLVDNIGTLVHSTMTCHKCGKILKEVYKKQGRRIRIEAEQADVTVFNVLGSITYSDGSVTSTDV